MVAIYVLQYGSKSQTQVFSVKEGIKISFQVEIKETGTYSIQYWCYSPDFRSDVSPKLAALGPNFPISYVPEAVHCV